MLKQKTSALIIAACAISLLLMFAAGCGSAITKLHGKGASNGGAEAGSTASAANTGNGSGLREAVKEAISYAQEANTGSAFKVVETKVVGDWAKVDVQETGVPNDEAVEFSVFLRRLGQSSWEVLESGSGGSLSGLPGVPPELLEE